MNRPSTGWSSGFSAVEEWCDSDRSCFVLLECWKGPGSISEGHFPSEKRANAGCLYVQPEPGQGGGGGGARVHPCGSRRLLLPSSCKTQLGLGLNCPFPSPSPPSQTAFQSVGTASDGCEHFSSQVVEKPRKVFMACTSSSPTLAPTAPVLQHCPVHLVQPGQRALWLDRKPQGWGGVGRDWLQPLSSLTSA